MILREITCTLISFVESASGCPVVVSEDVSLKTLLSLNTLLIAGSTEIKLDNESLVTSFRGARHRVSLHGYLKFFK